MDNVNRMIRNGVRLALVLWFCGMGLSGYAAAPDHDEEEQLRRKVLKITGVVIDEKSEPIVGATVLEKGTTNGVATDVDGRFTLEVRGNAVLSISFIGYVTEEVLVTNTEPLQVQLKEDTEELDEVVVVGYGSVKRKNFTGAVSTVRMNNSPLALLPNSNPMSTLRGTVAGLTVGQEQGAGQAPSLQVRGQRSINGGNDPLIVMDGVIFMGSLRDIDPTIIESMNVLKDATSLAAYGSQAANGVIMITTKQGMRGKPTLNFNFSWTLSEMANRPDLLSPEKYLRKVNAIQGFEEDADPSIWMTSFELENYKKGHITDWFDYVTRLGVMQNYSVELFPGGFACDAEGDFGGGRLPAGESVDAFAERCDVVVAVGDADELCF